MFTANNILVNPTPGSSHIASRSLIINSLTMKAQKMISLNSIRMLSCWLDNQNNLYVHLNIFSESNPNAIYDVIFEFSKIKYLNGEKVIDGVFKDKNDMKVFSNSPEFVFTYANAFNKRGLLINKYKPLLGTRALNDKAKVKNPNSEIGMSTSLFCCLKFLELNGFFGNYNYIKFVSGRETNPKPFSYIESISKKGKK